MRKSLLLTLFASLLPYLLFAQGHRIGTSLGSASGTHTANGEELALSGELLELPVYTYTTESGLTIGFRLMEFLVKGTDETGSSKLDMSFKQSLLAASIGFEFDLNDFISICPQYVKSYTGNSRFTYTSYGIWQASGYNDYEYVEETEIITEKAELSAIEIPVYITTKYFLFGLKLATYTDNTEIEWSDGTSSEISLNSALQFMLETRF